MFTGTKSYNHPTLTKGFFKGRTFKFYTNYKLIYIFTTVKAGFHIVVSGRFGSFRVVPSLSERRRQLKRPYTTGDFHMVVWGRLVVVWNAVVKTGPGADNTIFSGKLVQNGGCSRPHGRSAGIFTSAL